MDTLAAMEGGGSSWHGVELRHFAAFEAVARTRSFSAAALSLGYTQSAVSGQITALERIVGARLFTRIRGSRAVELTEAGRALVGHASAITARVAAAALDLESVQLGHAGVVRIGTFQTAAQTLLADMLRALAGAESSLRTTLYEDALIENLITMLERGEIDLAFVLLPVNAPEVETVELIEDPWYLLVPSDHALAGETLLQPEDLAGVPLISLQRMLPPALPARSPRSIYLVEDAILAAGVVPDIALRLNDYHSVSVLVEAGMGCGLVPSLALDPRPEVIAIPIDTRLPPRIVGIAWLRERQQTSAIARVIATAREVARDYALARR
jgi:DNA-binding transcriptional LysR family regulator